MDHEIKKLMKLKLLKENLTNLLQQIDSEINQTDIEWMNLKSLITPTIQTIKTESGVNQKNKISQSVKTEHHIDDPSVNQTSLDLSLGDFNLNNSLEEESD